eukprot:CAMPEP_0174710064 /NCGR_PEP_ID=MMETSP1094-20130205/11810_1 /TAXON_ID=156173 /ORGANISM="Chrysochromulina brevifilum, Strain UTEX LB 985" /LENGTH=80 /DNA_ID=CAMNT_0015908805 /DNA_START=50 /DNA_END=292 /DNA_ORIENTATION=+
MPLVTRPSLYRTIRVVMSDGATFHVPTAVRTVSNTLQLERDPANHPMYLGTSDANALLNRREGERLARVQARGKKQLFDD